MNEGGLTYEVPEDILPQEADSPADTEGDALLDVEGDIGEEAIEGEPEGLPLSSPAPVDVTIDMDYDAVYDAVYSASFDAIEAYSQSVTDGQSVNNTALSYFQGILGNCFWPVDYVIYVGSPYSYGNQTYYEYCMAYGDLSVDGTHFTGDDATVVTMRCSTYDRRVTYVHGQSVSLYAPMYYSRSNLGDYSGVHSYDWTGLLLLLTAMIGGVTWLVRRLLRLSY